MAKFMSTWRMNPSAPWPIDPAEVIQLSEMMYAAIDEEIKSGRILEFSFFASGTSGYAISTGEDAKGEVMAGLANFPWILTEVHEVLDYETGKEITRRVLKAQAEQMAAMKP
jgi:hypothetical protein